MGSSAITKARRRERDKGPTLCSPSGKGRPKLTRDGFRQDVHVVTVEDVRAFAMTLPRTTEVLVRDRVKFRVGRIVYVAFSRDETVMGFAFSKEEREAIVRSDRDKFLMPGTADLRYHWLEVRLDAIDETEMHELVLDAWRMVVPKGVAAAYDHDA